MLTVPPEWQSDQMQTALKECITALQSVFVQRHTIISTKSTQDEMLKQQEAMAASQMTASIPNGQKYSMSDALDQAFAVTHL